MRAFLFYILRVILILTLSTLVVIAYQKGFLFSSIIIGFTTIGLIIELYYSQNKTNKITNRIIQSMIYEDYTIDMDKSKTLHSCSTLKNVQRLYDRQKQNHKANLVQELVYDKLLNSLETGILILEKQKDATWKIFLINDYFTNLFSIPKINSWKSLSKSIHGFTQHIEKLDFKESKETIEIKINNDTLQTFILQTSITKSPQNQYYIILLDSIQKVLDKKEKDTWENLLKVISHEIMNSLTPIHSLAHNTREILQTPSLEQEDMDDLLLSVETIINRTQHLKQFIDNYRKLTMLPLPNKKPTKIKNTLDNVYAILRTFLEQKDIIFELQCSQDLEVNWDPLQMEQVFINLLTNAMYAVEKQNKPRYITCKVHFTNHRLNIDFIDNGPGITSEIQKKIFIPFYTTRIEGAGIGLPLSKNIVEMHNGILSYSFVEKQSIFTCSFALNN
ncbi:sensor histidine kinase [Myroides sp. LJL116]